MQKLFGLSHWLSTRLKISEIDINNFNMKELRNEKIILVKNETICLLPRFSKFVSFLFFPAFIFTAIFMLFQNSHAILYLNLVALKSWFFKSAFNRLCVWLLHKAITRIRMNYIVWNTICIKNWSFVQYLPTLAKTNMEQI